MQRCLQTFSPPPVQFFLLSFGGCHAHSKWFFFHGWCSLTETSHGRSFRGKDGRVREGVPCVSLQSNQMIICSSNAPHLFISGMNCLYLMSLSYGFPYRVFSSVQEGFIWWSEQCSSWRTLFVLACWLLWKWRNAHIFEDPWMALVAIPLLISANHDLLGWSLFFWVLFFPTKFLNMWSSHHLIH